MEGQQQESVQQFCSVTAATPEQAKFYLESCMWQLDSAIHSFFENDAGPAPDSSHEYEQEDDEVTPPVVAAGAAAGRTPAAVPAAASAGASAPASGVPSSGGQAQGQGRWVTRASGPAQGSGSLGGPRPKSGKDKSAAKSNGGRGGITTLSDLNRHPDSDSDSDGPQEYYTGGEKSGMMVQDPSRSHRDVDSIFDRARQFGAREGIVEAPPAPSIRGAFSGMGRTISGEPRAQEPGQASGPPPPPQPVFHTITFWRNGFTVDDGPLRRLDDPANAPFLASINKTECPRELEPADRNTPVHVNLVKKDEEWQAPPEPKYVAFQGTGRTLGSSSQTGPEPPAPAPAAAAATPTVTIPTIPAPREGPPNQPFQGLVVDEKKPNTSIQLRLLDGTRMVARFNYHHTIADIRSFIDAARPGNGGPYQLQSMGFPPKQLSDSEQTIEQAGLINAVVIQRG
ncbi:hypothetical protein Mapa_015752 [Marchantia paleacea]|nr:hypothetical protein Mapa_015752 [Marchantia paleacea]